MCDRMENKNQLSSIRIFHLFFFTPGKMDNCSKSQNKWAFHQISFTFFFCIFCAFRIRFFFTSLHINIVSHCQLFGWTVIESNKVVWLTHICILFVFFFSLAFSESISERVNFYTSLIVQCIKFFNGSIQWQKQAGKEKHQWYIELNHINTLVDGGTILANDTYEHTYPPHSLTIISIYHRKYFILWL